MSICRFLACSWLFCSVALVQPAAAENKSALLIGINTYQSTGKAIPAPEGTTADPSGRWNGPVWENLDGALNDVNAIHDLLVSSKFGFPKKNIYILIESRATREQIVAAMHKYLLDEPAPGDTVLFYYAGHGSQRYNSKSEKPNHLDETMVTADANAGVFDVRDKEIARLFNQVVDKGIRLTAIWDSCHSGSIARGIPVGAPAKARFLPYDPRDAADPPDMSGNGKPVPRPEDRPHGALIFSATQSDQLASEWVTEDGTPHGAFTIAFLDVLKTLPAAAPAQDIYKRVKVLMQGMGLSQQQPVLAGPPDRRQAPLFGAGQHSGKLTVAVGSEGVKSDGAFDLDGGLALGLSTDSELKKVNLKPGRPEVRIRIIAAALGRSTAQVIPPSVASQIEPGDLFELDKWAAPEQSRLQVWMPPATLSQQEINRIAQELSELRQSPNVKWIEDPLQESPTHIVAWSGSSWRLAGGGTAGENLGANPTPKLLLGRLNVRAAKPNLFLELPPSKELSAALVFGSEGETSSVQIVPQPERAQYLLIGRERDAHVEYAWVQKNLSEDLSGKDANRWSADGRGTLCSPNSPYPPRTDWVPAAQSVDQIRRTAAKLSDYALQLARVRAWLELPVPPEGESAAFNYKLALKKVASSGSKDAGSPPPVEEGSVIEGETYGLVLRAQGDLPPNLRPRWVYVLGIECNGAGQLLYPLSGQGNFQPQRKLGESEWPREIDLTGETEKIEISAPYGVDTYVLLTTSDSLSDLSAFNFQGVLTRGERGGEAVNPLTRLLKDTSSNARGNKVIVPTQWSVQYLPILSVERSPAR